MKSRLLALALLAAACTPHALAQKPKSAPKKPVAPAAAVKAGEEVAVIDTTMGRIIFKFLPKKAPGTVANFKKLANKKFYNGTTFHRVIPGFMIQGGDPNSKKPDRSMHGMGGPGYNVNAEFNDTKHVPGIVSMARSQDPNSAGSQFFIMVNAYPSLDGQYTAFGQVVKGMDIANKIVKVSRDRNDNPDTPVVMKSVRIAKWPVK